MRKIFLKNGKLKVKPFAPISCIYKLKICIIHQLKIYVFCSNLDEHRFFYTIVLSCLNVKVKNVLK